MSIYRRDTTEQLTARRAALYDALLKRQTLPTEVEHNGSRSQYGQRIAELKREIEAIDRELDARDGTATPANRTFYLI